MKLTDLLEDYTKSREKKDFFRADYIRNHLRKNGITIQVNKDGSYTVNKIEVKEKKIEK